MKITLKKLKELKACSDGLEYFEANHGNEAELDKVLEKLRLERTTTDYICWLFRNLKLSGVAEKWHEDGQLAERENYKNGELDGLREEWYEDGQLKLRENYKNGEQID
jgi:hypothetical protein